jgi:hypothetical protein
MNEYLEDQKPSAMPMTERDRCSAGGGLTSRKVDMDLQDVVEKLEANEKLLMEQVYRVIYI